MGGGNNNGGFTMIPKIINLKDGEVLFDFGDYIILKTYYDINYNSRVIIILKK